MEFPCNDLTFVFKFFRSGNAVWGRRASAGAGKVAVRDLDSSKKGWHCDCASPRWVDSRFLGEFLGSEREHHTRRQAVRQRLADLVPHIIKLFEH